jgi:hypothetical protein
MDTSQIHEKKMLNTIIREMQTKTINCGTNPSTQAGSSVHSETVSERETDIFTLTRMTMILKKKKNADKDKEKTESYILLERM